ncbi:MAG: hypothetical protein HY908_07285 [Myxococcales bacterium]|nr:hypothetical protein [Myxococcales bacterium]
MVLFAAPTVASAQDAPYGQGKTPPKTPPKAPPTPPKAPPAAPKATPPAVPKATPPAAPKATPPAAPKATPPAAPKPTPAPVPAKPGPGAVPAAPAPVPAPVAAPGKPTPVPAAAPELDPIEHFKKVLAPHGSWVADPVHGQVWVPAASAVGDDFAPYRTNGHWVATDKDEWAWASDFDWGKVPFHYGRWIWRKPSPDAAAVAAPQRGWAWVPGKEFAPAWVVWRLGNPGTEYVGWAPMAPAESWVDGSGAAKKPGVLPFYFVETERLFDPQLGQHVVGELKLASGLLANSRIFEGAGAALAAATPSFALARIPEGAIPKLRVKSDSVVPPSPNPAAPADPKAAPEPAAPPAPVAAPPPAPAAPRAGSEGRFATPPPAAADEDDDDEDEDDDDDDEARAPKAVDPDDDEDDSDGRFATPPPPRNDDERAAQLRERHQARARVWRRIHRQFWKRPNAALQAPGRDMKCGWTMTYPSYWRCGY